MRYGWIAGSVDPLWSIAVEEQFYMVIPVISRMGGRKLLAGISVVLLIISYITSLHYAHVVYSGESGQWVNSWFQFQFFAAGALLAISLRGEVPRWPLVIRGLVFVIAFACWMIAVMGPGVKTRCPYDRSRRDRWLAVGTCGYSPVFPGNAWDT